MAAAAEPGAQVRPGSDAPRLDSPELSGGGGGRGASPRRARARPPGPDAPGHRFRKVTLTKPTFCHLCSDFIWGLAGFLCEVCNFMSHEKCLKQVKMPCATLAPRLVYVPVAHCFGPRRLYKRRFCAVCRRGLEVPSLRCEVCELHVHPNCVPFACSDCRQCHCDGHWDQDTHLHHWREGNPPSCARCQVCRKTCGSSDVLAGIHCEWCGTQVHSICAVVLADECTFGPLHTLTLPPTCVRLLSSNFSKMHCFRILHPAEPGDWEDGEDSSTSLSREGLAPESGKQTLRIFDGDDAVQRNHFRVIVVPRQARSEELVEAALRAYYLPDDPEDFELQPLPVASEGDVPTTWILRAWPRTQEVLNIYPAWLQPGVSYVSVCVTPQSTVGSAVLEALLLLGCQAQSAQSFQLVEVLMDSRQVQRTPLADSELLLDRLRALRQASLHQMNQVRFYVADSRTTAPRVSLFVGGLPCGLSLLEYRNLLEEALATKAGLVSVSHVYSSQGAVVLEVSCFTEAERLYMLVRETAVCGHPLNALVLPEVLHMKLPPSCRPLLVFVNPKSGGLQGRDLLSSFRKLLNPHQVFDLTNGGPVPGFHLFAQVPCFRVLVCGGDGTVGWVLAALEELRHCLACPDPSVAILPLGTGGSLAVWVIPFHSVHVWPGVSPDPVCFPGNDLGRVLRWGPGYSGEDPLSVLLSVDEADAVLVDRWTILLDAQQDSSAETSVANIEPPKIVQMSNYCGIGIDAELSLDFHQAREEEPGKFTSRFHNKGMYVRAGLQKMNHSRGLHKEVRLQVGQQEVTLPSLEGLIFINIPSWGSGADLWGSDNDSRFKKPRMDDGLLEVVGVTGVLHMGQVQGGLRSGIRIAQGSYFRVTLLKATAVQVDGEPWIQAPGHIIISAAGPKVHMLRKAKQKPRKADEVSAPSGDK
ncbi:diacylglycerol kinase theta isoform X3 [Suncus etruscus]|uniref:diacylglycerol kinase theta isoform X3 n=1 Tax=Suncus etruscus TaxID=109475 RepID=UPI002110DE11|nr:diacylglycerol kinase theta isoform X3 [Suncus etruscus]